MTKTAVFDAGFVWSSLSDAPYDLPVQAQCHRVDVTLRRRETSQLFGAYIVAAQSEAPSPSPSEASSDGVVKRTVRMFESIARKCAGTQPAPLRESPQQTEYRVVGIDVGSDAHWQLNLHDRIVALDGRGFWGDDMQQRIGDLLVATLTVLRPRVSFRL